jgi:predicted esterase
VASCGPEVWGQAPPSPEPRPGEVVAEVACKAKGDQSYAVYVPSAYTPDRVWPIVYVLEPAARGKLPVEAMRHGAEGRGLIVAASNNSRNGPLMPSLEALDAMWTDTHSRLSIDDRRIYFAGFSGGARAASQLAQACKCTHGVFLNGAGLVGGGPPTKEITFPIFATVGTSDFNYGEMVRLDAGLESLGVPHVLRRFEGPHQWAPPEVWDEAFVWISLLEMKDGRRARDASMIQGDLEAALERARKLDETGQAYLALRGYQVIAATFQGLADASAATAHVAALEKTSAAREGAKREKKSIEREEALYEGPRRALAALRDPGADSFAAWRDARLEVERLRDRHLKDTRPDERLALDRAHSNVTALIVETGRGLLDEKSFGEARRYFELATVSQPSWAWPRISLARCLAAMGDRKGAIRELERAKEGGATLADLPGRFPELASLASDPAFVALAGAAPGPATTSP